MSRRPWSAGTATVRPAARGSITISPWAPVTIYMDAGFLPRSTITFPRPSDSGRISYRTTPAWAPPGHARLMERLTIPKKGTKVPLMGTSLSLKQHPPPAEMNIPDTSPQSMADALYTTTQQRLLGLLFGQPRRSFFVTELIDLARVGRGAVQRELARLERSGLVVTERYGNRKHYRANADAPIYKELCSIMLKTVGIREQVQAALEPLTALISFALIYGSVAKQADTAQSDIDLLVVSDDLTLEELYTHLSPAEKRLGRQISPTLYTVPEFNQRRENGNPFLKRVLEGPTVLLKGDIDAA